METALVRSKPRIALSIAGFDPSSGAGISADLLVFAAHGIFGISCPTALTTQSTTGVAGVRPVDPGLLQEMLACVVADLPPAGVKIGMLANKANVLVVAEFIVALRRSYPDLPIVVDPVLRSSSGRELLDAAGIRSMQELLFPQVTCATPNREEFAVLSGEPVGTREQLFGAGGRYLVRARLQGLLVTGGDAKQPQDVIFRPYADPVVIGGTRVVTSSTHGTGCAFSSALLSRLIAGEDLVSAAIAAKRYVEESLRLAPGLGQGKGPLHLLHGERSPL